MKHHYTGLRRIFSAFKNSFDGFVYAFKEEEAFRQDLLLCLILAIVILFLPFGLVEKIILSSSLFFILFAELTNSGIEACIDRISPEWHKLSKSAKDIGSLLVLISFIYLFFVWGVIFYNYFK